MEPSSRARQANLLAVAALGVNDVIRDAEEAAAGHGSAAPAALVALHEFLGGSSLDQLRHVVGLTPSGAVRLVDKLSGEGLLTRAPGTDKRAVSLRLTRRGASVARRILAAREAAAEALLSRLSPDERQALTPVLERLLEELTAARIDRRAGSPDEPSAWLCRLCDLSACRRAEGACPVATRARSVQPS
jgi:MarR family transcriptional repressor of emrRAB